jgi:hypothetical protein
VVNATFWFDADAEVRRHGYQTGLETPVVHAVNQECYEIVPNYVRVLIYELTRKHSAWVLQSQG